LRAIKYISTLHVTTHTHIHRHTHSLTFLKVVLISRESTSKVIMTLEVGSAVGRQTSDILGEKKRSSQMKRV